MARKRLTYRDSMLDDLLPHVEAMLRRFTVAELAEEAEVSVSCIYGWINRVTRHPRSDTLLKVATACGLEWRLVRIGSNTGEAATAEVVDLNARRRQHGRKR